MLLSSIPLLIVAGLQAGLRTHGLLHVGHKGAEECAPQVAGTEIWAEIRERGRACSGKSCSTPMEQQVRAFLDMSRPRHALTTVDVTG